jgi:hypothetical protein
MNDRRISRWLSRGALALALAAVAPPVAQGSHAPAPPDPSNSQAGLDAATRHHHPDVVPGPTRIVAVAPAQGFDWGDAGIGAGGALGAVLVAGGSALLLKRRARIVSVREST